MKNGNGNGNGSKKTVVDIRLIEVPSCEACGVAADWVVIFSDGDNKALCSRCKTERFGISA